MKHIVRELREYLFREAPKHEADRQIYAQMFGARLSLLSHYYDTPENTIKDLLANTRGRQRTDACRERGIDPHILRTMLEYTRYPEARNIEAVLYNENVPLQDLSILDFGCLVSDYGIYFGRRGATISIYDRTAYVDFAVYRYNNDSLLVRTHKIPTCYKTLVTNIDMVIFGEVLEHLHDPLAPIRACVDSAVSLIYTSCYPFGDDKYFALPGHTVEAQMAQVECLRVLRKNFVEIDATRSSRLWKRAV